MNRRIFAAVATAIVILPLGVKAAQNNLQNNNLQNNNGQILPVAANQIAHNNFSGGNKRGRGERMEQFLQQLDLTSEQSQKISAIREESNTENEALYREISTNHEQMRSLFANNADSEELRQQYQKIKELREQLADNRFEMMLQVREVLTPEQLTKMSELMAQHQGKRGNHRF